MPAHHGVDHDQRDLFVAFLERFADGQADREQWERLVVNHYLDGTLERVRRDVVRIRMDNEAMRWSPEERSRIWGWIRELRVDREADEQLVARLRTALEIHSPALHEGLCAALTERTFPPHPRFKQSTPPALDDSDALRGVHVIYFCPDWQVVIGGLSRAAAWKCGVRVPIDLRAKTPWDDHPDGEFVVDAAVRWVIDAWRAVRHVAPDLRGFMSEHDGGEMIDLDSGQAVPEDQVGMGPL